MKLFGGLLPFIGFREEPVSPAFARYLDLPAGTRYINTFQVAWFGWALCVALNAVQDE